MAQVFFERQPNELIGMKPESNISHSRGTFVFQNPLQFRRFNRFIGRKDN